MSLRSLAHLSTIVTLFGAQGAFAQTAIERNHAKPENTREACSDHLDNDMDGHEDCDDQDCQDLVICASSAPNLSAQPTAATPTLTLRSDIAERRGKATTKLVAGAIMLPLGFLVAATSAAPYYFMGDSYGSAQKGYIAGGVLLDVAGVALMAAGGALVAISTGELAATAPSRQARLQPSLAFTTDGFRAGVGGRF
jgi:hypothetical protein